MKTLSVKQPWAWAIIHAGKDVENRVWKTPYRGPIYIQASHQIDRNAPAELLSTYNELVRQGRAGSERGGIIGSVEIVDCVEDHESEWFTGPYAFVLKDPKPVPFFKCKGQLKFFNVEIPECHQ